MNKMMAAAAAAAGLSGAITGAAAWSGSAVVQRLQLQTTRFGKMVPGFKVLHEEVDRGLFSTTRTLHVQLGCLPANPAKQPAAPAPLELQLRDHVKHGPFPGGGRPLLATIDTELLPPARWKAELESLLGGQPLLRAHTEVDFAGELASDLTLPGVKLEDAAHGSFESSPLVVHVRTEGGSGDGLKYTVAIPAFTVRADARGEALALELGAFQGEGELWPADALSPWLTPGKTHGKLASLALTGSSQALGAASKPLHARFEELEFNATSKLERGLWSAENRARFKGKIDRLAIDKVELAASIARVHAASYDKLLGAVLGAGLECDPAAQRASVAALLAALREELGELLAHDPEYALDSLAIELEGKRAELSYAAGTRGVARADLDGDLAQLLMQKGVLRASAKVHFELLVDLMLHAGDSMPAGAGALGLRPGEREQAMVLIAGMLEPLIQSGYVVREGDFIKVSSTLEGGQLLVNGKPMGLPDLARGLGP